MKLISSVIFSFFMLLTAAMPGLCADTNPALGKNTDRIKLSSTAVFYHDVSGSKSFKEVYQLDDSQWEAIGHTQLGTQKGAVWFRLNLNRIDPLKRWYLTETTITFDYADYFIPKGDSYYEYKYGVLRDNPHPGGHRTLKIELDASSNPRAFVRISTSTPVTPNFELLTDDGFAQRLTVEGYAFGVIYGMALVILVMNVVLGVTLKQREHLYFAGYILSFCLLGTYFQGIHYQLFSTGITVNDLGLDLEKPATTFGLAVFMTSFMYFLLCHRVLHISGDRISFVFFTVVGVILLLITAPQLLVKNVVVMQAYSALKVAIIISVLLFCIYAAKRDKDVSVWLFGASTVFPAIGVLIYYGTSFGFVKLNMFTMYATHFMSLGEYALISFAIATRMSHVRQKQTEKINSHVVELTKAKNEADKGSEAKDRFLASVSHELRTPLNVIGGTLQILEESPLKSMQSSMLGMCIDQTTLLEKLVNDVIDYSQIERGVYSYEKEPCDPYKLVEDTVAVLERSAAAKGVELMYEGTGAQNVNALIDPNRLRQLVFNLVTNSIKFTNEGQVRVSLQSRMVEGNSISYLLEVKDTGVGIPQENLDSIFGEFTTSGQSSDNSENQGMGLGLAIVDRIVDLFGGDIAVQSTLGLGSTFSFSFVADSGEARGEMAVKSVHKSTVLDAQERFIESQNSNILLVEDNSQNQFVFKHMLLLRSIDLCVASSVDEAIGQMRSNSFDIIFSDLSMPGKSGFDLVKYVREELKNMEVHMVAVSADTRISTKERCFEFGFNSFLCKPFNKIALFQEIANYRESRRKAKEVVSRYSGQWLEQ